MVNIDTVRKDLFLGNINYIFVAAVDFFKAYLHRFTKENIYTLGGPEFVGRGGQVLICVISFFGLKTSMDRYHVGISDKLELIGFFRSKADLDLYM